MVHSLGGNIPISPRMDGDLNQSPAMSVGQPIDQTQAMASILGNQVFIDTMSGNGSNLHSTNLDVRSQSQQPPGFGITAQQIRTVGDFQALQRANSDINPLNPIVMNDLGNELGFSALR